MRKVFWDDPYKTKHQSKIIDIKDDWVLLDETVIFSFSGGQESDKRFIANNVIIDSRKEDNLIFYKLLPNHNLNIGGTVEITIDWERHYALMRLHFAAELLPELITKSYQLATIGAHIAQDKARIDFIYDNNIANLFDEILE